MTSLPVARQYRRALSLLAVAAGLVAASSCADAPTAVGPGLPAAASADADVNEYGIPPLDTALYVSRESSFNSPWDGSSYRCDRGDSLPQLLVSDAYAMCVEFIHPATDRRLTWTQLKVPVGDSLLVRCATMDWRYPDNRIVFDARYRWNYGNPQVATVHPVAAGGVQTAWVKGVAPGTGPLKCLVNSGTYGQAGYWETSGAAQVEVTGEARRLVAIVLPSDTVRVELGEGKTHLARHLDQYGHDSWIDPSISRWELVGGSWVASPSPAFSFTASALGTMDVRKVWDGPDGPIVSNVATVVVTRGALARVQMSQTSASLYQSDAPFQVTAWPQNRFGYSLPDVPVTWSSADTSVVTVSQTGLVTVKGPGKTMVYAQADTARGATEVTVKPRVVTRIVVSPAQSAVAPYRYQALQASAYDQAGLLMPFVAVAWTSSNTAVATVTDYGTVMGKSDGAATITATANGVSGSAAITVASPVVTSVSLFPSSLTLVAGTPERLTATVRDQYGTVMEFQAMTWTSLNDAIATVDQYGIVAGRSAGTTSIRVTSSGRSATAAVTVQPAPPPTGPCLDAAGCLPVQASYVSHFTNADCTGTEYYYTAYYNFDGKRRSWNGGGVAGKTVTTMTVKSYKLSDGGGDGTGCRRNVWGAAGYTFQKMSRIYR